MVFMVFGHDGLDHFAFHELFVLFEDGLFGGDVVIEEDVDVPGRENLDVLFRARDEALLD